MDLKNQIDETADDIKEELGKVKSWPIVKWLKKWIGIIAIAVIVIMFVIILALSGVRYSTGSCPEILRSDKHNIMEVVSRCRENDRGDWLNDFIDNNKKMVPDDFTIYNAMEYRDFGVKGVVIKGKK